eukprot:182055-Prorocentrum_minimum.AAC.1
MHYFVVLISTAVIVSSLVVVIGISWINNKAGDYVPSFAKGLVSGFLPVVLTIVYMILVKLILRNFTLHSARP